MARNPRIPMLPTELPQQRLYLVKGLPERPANWSITLGTQAEGLAPTAMPRITAISSGIACRMRRTVNRSTGYKTSADAKESGGIAIQPLFHHLFLDRQALVFLYQLLERGTKQIT